MRFIALSLFVALGWVASTQSISAQDKQQFEAQKEIIKQRKELAKQTKKSVEANAWKEAKKAAKQMKKEGWKAMPGSPTLETQMNDYLLRRYSQSGNFPKYILEKVRLLPSNRMLPASMPLPMHVWNWLVALDTK